MKYPTSYRFLILTAAWVRNILNVVWSRCFSVTKVSCIMVLCDGAIDPIAEKHWIQMMAD